MTRKQRIISFCIAMIGVLIIIAIAIGRKGIGEPPKQFTPEPEEYTPTERRIEEEEEVTEGEEGDNSSISAEITDEEIKNTAFLLDTHSISSSAQLGTHIFNLASEGANIFNPGGIEDVTDSAKSVVANIAYQRYLARLEAQRKAEEKKKQESKPVEAVVETPVEEVEFDGLPVEEIDEIADAEAQAEADVANEPYVKPSDFKWMGTCHYNGWKWTYYSQRVLPGGGLSIPGRHVDSDGFVCDENGYIVLASTDAQDKKDGAVYWTPFGRWGKVYDFCGGVSEATLDVYVDW